MSEPPPHRDSRSVDVVIATHSAARPVERAVASVLDGAVDDVRVLLVCHGLDPAPMLGRLRPTDRQQVTAIRHDDGVASPAGPFNAGLRAATATYVSVMGSDDFLRPGAVAAWLDLAESRDAVAVLARLEHQAGGLVRTPPTRAGRRSERLDFVRDRLAYRTAPLGLLRRDVLVAADLWLTEGVETGEDIAFSLRMFSEFSPVAYAGRAPAYVIGDDATNRVTGAPRPIAVQLAPVAASLEGAWASRLPRPALVAAVVKLLRIHVFGAIALRTEDRWTASERADLASVVRRVVAVAPEAVWRLSRVEYALLRTALDVASPASELVELSRRRTRHGRPETVLTARARRLLDPQAPLRVMAASALMR